MQPETEPQVIGGRYQVVRAIGRGGMGTVWLCRDRVLQRDVAVKQVGLLPGVSATDSARALREARSSAALSHRNVVTVFDVVEEGSAIWMVMELVAGHSLAELVSQQGPLDPGRVADVGAQVGDGLAAAHALGIVHRDVKPGNVLVRDDGLAAISDFGIARSAGDPALTQSGLLTGTPSYFSPELARGGQPSPAADVWALGATLYAAVQGRPPYRPRDNPVAVLHDIASSQPPKPDRAGPLEPLLLRMLDRDPDSRWSMVDAAHALHRLAREHAAEGTRAETLHVAPWAAADPARSVRESLPGSGPGAAAPPAERTPPAPVTEPPGPAPEPPGSASHRWRGLLLAALALLLVAGGAAYALTRGDGERPTASGPQQGASGAAGGRSPASADPSSPRTPTRSSTASSPTARPSSSSSGTPSPTGSGPGSSPPAASTLDAASVSSFLEGYFDAAPGGSAQAWAQLGPGEQAQGRASYDRFWRGIASVQVSDVEPVDADTVEATLTYRRTGGGGVSVERQRIDLLRSSDGGYLINGDEPVGSG